MPAQTFAPEDEDALRRINVTGDAPEGGPRRTGRGIELRRHGITSNNSIVFEDMTLVLIMTLFFEIALRHRP